MSSDAELDAKLTELLRVMVSRLPPNKKLPTAVVQQLLRSKYGDTYSEAYVNSHEAFIADTILKLSIEKEKAAMAATTGAVEERHEASSTSSAASDDDEGDDDTDDDEEASANSDGEDDEEEDFDTEEEEEEESDSDDDDSDGSSDAESDRKKARTEMVEAIARNEKREQHGLPTSSNGTDTTAATLSVAERCKAMAECLRKLRYRVRAPAEAETLEDYLQNFLIAEFQKHDMDPEKYSKSDIKRYRIKREVELLQQDGASLSLDRRNRAGRGFSNVHLPSNGGSQDAAAPPTITKQTSMFLDDE
jgi:cobalamin biosynthesis protein CobT